ncbi:Bug family tripartite tricarboxylate transporter substrate binding protein [Pseudoclavibacter sp. 8L]|uniref:Bug family tripartite tricarboxylate transporter substrate binding protein n=1 Tax=Pseudoclavibacter sp. 8L TaxID=2653162 RepID=UPI0012F0905D|nr:tripartite tricarboxylate transporter substrate binding protein [Pseudoclavibacter sp. 8L]VXC06627.1 Metal ABC transporter substrate-binding protein [Pseudoclavibacter sp. 8L]
MTTPLLRRVGSVAAVAALVGTLAACSSQSEPGAYPDGPITYVIPFSPGGSSDPVGREFARMLGEELGSRAIVENLPGGDQAIGIANVLTSDSDGQTLGLATTSGLVVQPIINDNLGYTGRDDYDPLVKMVTGPYGLFVPTSSPYETLEDFISAAKSQPGELRVGTTARISDNSFALFTLEDEAGIETTMVPYPGGAGEAVLGALGGQIDAVVATASGQMGLVEAGDLRPLAHTGPTEYNTFLDGTPSFEELGYDVPFASQFMTIAPPGLSDETRQAITDASLAVVNSPEWIEWCESQSILPDNLNGAELDEFLDKADEASVRALELADSREG